MILPGTDINVLSSNELNVGDQVYDRYTNKKGFIKDISSDGWVEVYFEDKTSAYTIDMPLAVYLGPAKVENKRQFKTKNGK